MKERIDKGKAKVNLNDIVGKSFNEFIVLAYDHSEYAKSGDLRHYYKCKCSCGKEFLCMRSQILPGKTKSCGHLNHQIKDISGNKYGRLKVISLAYIKNEQSYYNCICDCGTKCIKGRKNLVAGLTKSCGCLSKEVHSKLQTTHGMSKTRLFSIWSHIKDRCLNPNSDNYYNYGGRGIFVCQRWLDSFENFYNDMGEDYYNKANIYGESNISIDRINNNDGYYKENCRWATKKEQLNNTRRNNIVNINGKEFTLMEAYNNFAVPGLTYFIVRDRIEKLGWDVIRALTTPPDFTYARYTTNYNKECDSKYTNDKRAIYFDINKSNDL